MKTLRWTAFSLCMILLAAPASLASQTEAPARLHSLAEAMDQRTEAVETLRELDEKQLRDRIASLKRQLASEKKRLADATALLTDLRAEHKVLAEEYDTVAADMQSVEDAVRTNTAQFSGLIRKSASYSLQPEIIEPLEATIASSDFPGIETITALGVLMLDEIRSGATVQRKDAAFLGPDGTSLKGHLLRAGSMFLGAVDETGDAHLLLPGSEPAAAVASTPRRLENHILAWADGTGMTLPLDPSNGVALSILQSRRSVDDWIEGGGVLLWPILAVGLLALLAVAYKALVLLNARPTPGDFSRRLREAWDSDGWNGISTLLRTLPKSPAARALLSIDPDAEPDQYDKQMQEGFLAELRRLESMLGFIAVMAAVAPLLGLLGTVTGMIDSFQAITVFGSSNPRIMASGISEALITTQAGLGVAIPVMFLHQLLKQRVQTLAGDMEQQSAALHALVAGGQTAGDRHA